MAQTLTHEVADHYLDTSGTRVHFGTAGSGPETVVFIHGGGPGASSWSNFSVNVPAFADRHRAVLLDLPGYGGSGPSAAVDGASAFAYYAGVVRDVLDELGVDRAHIVGNSLGGGVAFRTAEAYPDRVGRLVLLGPAGVCYPVWSPSGRIHSHLGQVSAQLLREPSATTMRAFLEEMVYDDSMIDEAVVDERLEMLREALAEPEPGSPIFKMWLATDDRVVRFNPLDFESWRLCGNVSSPTLLIWGRDDHFNPVDGALYPLQYMPNAELQVFGRCGHWAQVEHQDQFDRAALEFLGRDA